MTPTPAPEPRSRPGPAAERGPRVFYGWWIVGGGFVISLLSGGLMFHAFSGYVLPLQREFGWSRSLISGAFSMAQAEGGLLGPAQGWLIDKFGPRALMRVGITMFGAGFILLSQVNGVVTFYAVFALLAIGSSLGTFLPMATIITNWFSRRRSMALGIFMTGMSAGGLLVPAIVWSLTTHGWRTTALVSGFLVLGIGLPMTQLMRRRPEDYGLLPDGAEQPPASASAAGAPAAEAAGPDDPDFTIGQALRTSSFWLLGIGHAAALLVVGAAIVHQIPHMVEGIGLSEGAASSIVALLVGTMIVGQLAGGYVGDRVEKRLVVTGCLLLHAAALLVFAFATTAWGAVAFAMMHGTAWGVRVPLVIAMRADYFGRKAYAQVMGFSSLVMMVGMTGGPLFGGFMRDMTGNYTTAFVILAVFAAAGSIAMLAARKPDPPGAGASG